MIRESVFYQQQLVRQLQQASPSLSERVLQAFGAIPRHPFVDHYYRRQRGESLLWTRYEREETAAWYEQIYQDDALVTRVDAYGRTLSSSSQPAVMARMLDALEVEPGMRILEIGTGTGYNAALLAHLTGDPRLVTTVEIDGEARARAAQTLAQVVGDGMSIVEADGRDGYAANAPYDRIIVTASSPMLAPAWQEQLAPGGILVGILQPRFAALGGLLKAYKSGERLEGKILQPASFMELRSVDYPKRRRQIDMRAPASVSFPFDSLLFQPRALRENHDFAFFLYYDLPDLHVFQKKEALFYYRAASPQGYVVFRLEPRLEATLCGDHRVACALWNRLVRASGCWEHLGRPSIPQYTVTMDEHGQSLALHTSLGVVWPFGIWEGRNTAGAVP